MGKKNKFAKKDDKTKKEGASGDAPLQRQQQTRPEGTQPPAERQPQEAASTSSSAEQAQKKQPKDRTEQQLQPEQQWRQQQRQPRQQQQPQREQQQRQEQQQPQREQQQRQEQQQPQREQQQRQQQQRGQQQGEQQQGQQQRGQQQQQSGQQQPSREQQQGQQQQWRQQQGQQQQWKQQQGQQQQPQREQQQRQQQQERQQQGQQQQPQREQQQRQQQQEGQQRGQQQQQSGQQQPSREQHQGQQQQWRQQQGQQQQWRQQQGQQQQPQRDQQQRQQQQEGQQQQRGQQQQGQQQRWQHQEGQQQRGQQQHWQQQRGQQQQSQQRPPQSTQQTCSPSSSAQPLISSLPVGNIPRGTVGKPGRVETNYLKLKLDKMPNTAYHYDVTIEPDRPKKFMRRVFDQFNKQFFENTDMAYDGVKSCYTVQKLPSVEFEGEIKIPDRNGRSMTFRVKIKETDNMEVDLNSLRNYSKERIYDKPMRALQVLEVILAEPCRNKAVRVGRSFYNRPQQLCDLDDGYELWLGLYQACILGDQPFLNVDISHKSFLKECKLLDYIRDYHRPENLNSPLVRWIFQPLSTLLRCINVEYAPPPSFNSQPRLYKVNGITDEPASKLSFTMEDGKRLTVESYFLSRGYKLQYPHLNCLHVGSTVRANYIPIELCNIPGGQILRKKDDQRQIRNMIRFAATSTNVRKAKIMHLLKSFEHNRYPKLQRFGIELDLNFIVIPTRLLTSPMLEYAMKKTVRPDNGVWQMRSEQFIQTKQQSGGHKWAIIFHKKGRFNMNTADNVGNMISRKARSLNMSLADKPKIEGFDRIDVALSNYKRDKYDLVIVVLPFNERLSNYAEIKKAAELQLGVLTQCIKEKTFDRCNDMLINNLLLKINAKLNGTNHIVSPSANVAVKNVMFLGADVTHPSPDQQQIPSVVGTAASHDIFGACYNMQYRLQSAKKEEIEDMDSICTRHLNVYHLYQKSYPEHIIYYRDGVSDGQFPKIRDLELNGIRAACKRLKINVKITCIIVVKRHHTRFFPEGNSGTGKFNNVAPGTVVDRVIVHPNEVQFFMVSHQSIQGTAKPTRYNVLVDEAKFDIDLLQNLTFNLCHLFPRCNRVVSYPAPAYLAHLVAARGRVYIEGLANARDLPREYERRKVNEQFMQTNPMYFV